MSEPSVVQALLEERDGYVRRCLNSRVADVDKVLATFGVAVAPEGHPITANEAPSLETADGKPTKKPATKPKG